MKKMKNAPEMGDFKDVSDTGSDQAEVFIGVACTKDGKKSRK
jgi:hypothetical protein